MLATVASAQAPELQQVSVAVKVVEFQTAKGVETGLSAYFKQRNDPRPYGRVSSGNGNITSADLTFPASTNAGITVFLDRLSNEFGDFEVVLQGLVDQNRAFILSRPKAMVAVGEEIPTVIETVQRIPYEDTRVVGTTTKQVTTFRDAGVMLNVKALQVIDDDGDVNTTEDTYLRLQLTARVNEQGQRITVALDDSLVSANSGSNAIRVPEFISREITTDVWVQHGQVLILGGLYRNTKGKTLSTLPWLTQAEDLANGLVQRLTPFSFPQINPSSGVGNRSTSEGRRELVFLIKAELWRPSFTVADEFGFDDEDDELVPKKKKSPTDIISDVLEDLSALPQGVAEGIAGQPASTGVTKSLGGSE